MKKLLLLFLLCSYGVYTSAQLFSLQKISYDEQGNLVFGEEVKNGGTIVVSELSAATGKLDSYVFLKNLTDRDINIGISAYREQMKNGSVEEFCYGLCYTSNGLAEQHYPAEGEELTLYANEEEEISFHCKPGEEGNNIVKYEFYDRDNSSEGRFYVTLVYGIGATNIADNTRENDRFAISLIGGTPTFTYEFTANTTRELLITNIAGMQLNSIQLMDLSGELPLTSLNKGIYLYSLRENGVIIETRKFIVH